MVIMLGAKKDVDKLEKKSKEDTDPNVEVALSRFSGAPHKNKEDEQGSSDEEEATVRNLRRKLKKSKK